MSTSLQMKFLHLENIWKWNVPSKFKASGEKTDYKNGLKGERWVAKGKKKVDDHTLISILSWEVLFFMSRIDANLNSSQSING